MAKVFLSYSRQDSAFVESLYRRLTRDGVDVFFDQESIEWGANWVNELEEGIDSADYIVLVLSPDFDQSKWANLERTSADISKIRPLLLRDVELRRFLKPIQCIDVRTDAAFEAAYPRICKSLGGRPLVAEASEDRSQLPSVKNLPSRSLIPFGSLGGRFCGRVEDLWSLHDLLRQGQTAIVSGVGLVVGIGGLGKSQLAIEYAHRFAHVYHGGIFWVRADTGMSSAISEVANAAGVDLDGTLAPEDQARELWRRLSGQAASILVILDNFPELVPLRPWLPVGVSIHTLVTTRRQDLSGYPRLPLSVLSGPEGLALLNSGDRTFGDEALPLVAQVGGLPLALELLCNTLNQQPGLSISDLLSEIERIGEIDVLQLLAADYRDQLPSGHETDIISTFRLSWDQASADAQLILQFLSILSPEPVPRRLLRQILDWPESSPLDDPLAQGLKSLSSLSLVDFDTDHDPRVHRLIMGFVSSVFPLSDDQWTRAVTVVREDLSRTRDTQDASSFVELEKVFSHGLQLSSVSSCSPESRIDILNFIGWHHRQWGRYRLAEACCRQGLDVALTHFDGDHLTISVSQSYLGQVLKSLGDYEGAKSLLSSALSSAEAHYQPGHPEISTHQSNLGLVLKDLGDYEGAKSLLSSALVSDESHYESGHPHITISQSNLGMVLKDLGDYEGAKSLLSLALSSAESHYEPGHPEISIRQSNLGLVLKDLGDYEGAKSLLSSALSSDEEHYEPGHPEISRRRSNLGQVLQALGDYEGAKSLLSSALSSDEEHYEPGHPEILISQSNLGQVLQALGDYEGAKSLLSLALSSAEEHYELGHPYISRIQSNLGMVLKDLGDYEDAKSLLSSALSSKKEHYEPGHPEISISQSNLGVVLYALGDYEGAQSLLSSSLASAKLNYPPGHPHIGLIQGNLNSVLRELGE